MVDNTIKLEKLTKERDELLEARRQMEKDVALAIKELKEDAAPEIKEVQGKINVLNHKIHQLEQNSVTPKVFSILVGEYSKARPFLSAHSHPEIPPTTDGGQELSWEFTETSLGVIKTVNCSHCKVSVDVTDYNSW